MHWALRMMWPVLSRQDSLDLTVFYSWLVSNCLLGIQRSLLCLRIWQSIRSGMRRLGTKLEMWAQRFFWPENSTFHFSVHPSLTPPSSPPKAPIPHDVFFSTKSFPGFRHHINLSWRTIYRITYYSLLKKMLRSWKTRTGWGGNPPNWRGQDI